MAILSGGILGVSGGTGATIVADSSQLPASGLDGDFAILNNGAPFLRRDGSWSITTPGLTGDLSEDAASNACYFDAVAGDTPAILTARGWTETLGTGGAITSGADYIEFSRGRLEFTPDDWGDVTLFAIEALLSSGPSGGVQNLAGFVLLDDGTRRPILSYARNNVAGMAGWVSDFDSEEGAGSYDVDDYERIYGVIERTGLYQLVTLYNSEGIRVSQATYDEFAATTSAALFVGTTTGASGNVLRVRRFAMWSLS